MSTKFFTNSEENTLINKFEGVFTYNPNIQYFDALVGYFRASGYFRIRPFLDKVPKIRILVGISADRLIEKAKRAGLEFFKNHDKTKEEFIQQIQKDIEPAPLQCNCSLRYTLELYPIDAKNRACKPYWNESRYDLQLCILSVCTRRFSITA